MDQSMAGLEEFDRWLTARQYAARTRGNYLSYVARADLFCMDLANATTVELADWLQTLPGTAPSKIAGRKSLAAYYRSIGRDPSPVDGLPRLPEPSRLPRPLSASDHLLWITAARNLGGLHEIAGVLMATTGARIGELRAAEWSDLSLGDPGWWRIRGKGARRSGLQWRQQPLHPIAVEVLDLWPQTGRWVFPGKYGPLTDGPMRALILEIGEHAGLGRVLPHVCRHSVGTLALAQTGDLRAVQLLLGHRSIASTTLYTQVLPDRLRSVVAGLLV